MGSSTTLSLKHDLVSQMQHRFVNTEADQTLAKSTLLDPHLKKLAFWNNKERQGVQSLVEELSLLPDEQEEDATTVAPTMATSNVLWKEFDSKGQ